MTPLDESHKRVGRVLITSGPGNDLHSFQISSPLISNACCGRRSLGFELNATILRLLHEKLSHVNQVGWSNNSSTIKVEICIVCREKFSLKHFSLSRAELLSSNDQKAVWANSKQPHRARHKKVSNLIFNFVSSSTDSLQGYHEKKLLNHLLNNYNLLERPVANESDPLEVRFGLTLQQIIDVVSMLWHLDFKFLLFGTGWTESVVWPERGSGETFKT